MVAETDRYLKRWRLAIVAKYVCNVISNHTFALLVANRSKKVAPLPKSTIVAHCMASSGILSPVPTRSNSANMTQLYKEAKSEEQKLEKHFAVVKQNVSRKQKVLDRQTSAKRGVLPKESGCSEYDKKISTHLRRSLEKDLSWKALHYLDSTIFFTKSHSNLSCRSY